MSTLKEQGNEAFKAGDYSQALRLYTRALLADPSNAALYSNRAFCYIKLECFKAAITDAEKCVSVDPNFTKGFYRQASAHAALGQLPEAISACDKAKKLAPKDQVICKLLTALKEKRREQLFMEAIAVEEENETTNWRDMDASSAAFKIDDDKPITPEIAELAMKKMSEDTEYGKTKLHLKYVLRIIDEVREILKKRSTIQEINTNRRKMTIVGDVHGQFFDLLHLFQVNGIPSENNMYLFNGDYVDRGSFGVECVLTLFLFMIAFPNSLYLARGNHETKSMNSLYGFEGEVRAKLGEKAYKAFEEVFTQLPLGHIIDNSIFVVHGGIPPDFVTIKQLKEIKRGGDPVEESIASALIWADPQSSNGTAQSIRGTGKSFGPDVTANFLDGNNLKYLVRSHEMKMEGFEWAAQGRLITVFSAPNYCDAMKNKGAYVHVVYNTTEKDEVPTLKVETFVASPHPNIPAMAYATLRGAV
ncbi:serine/threonine protein phosphatase, putative [Entamoeba invadens IP1]|uniref:serine/threonine protein phosphatase, putative n=1 Tax=Entamoeba invadens IP1 TaxID=370355 RepID=UPI0002C3DD73|nr:serine/threonine protein phosphatase, putative [Entamoeba invadens IP1]ELP85390.1 serine/threonine protein phosphatase, putative [Entamoeba invadens IP1]|eukprot:XP_004184736.1 serine/threonine protein phosphatase, putative [Entamoeba invadens IP1]